MPAYSPAIRNGFAALLLGLCLLVAALAAGAQERVGGEPMMLPVDPVPLVAETAWGERRFSIEVARTPAEQARGLMFRREMPVDRGMLFVLEQTRPASFWMRNTPMPLDLLFIGEDGRLRAILHGEPFSEASISPGAPVRFVLELKAGTAQIAGIATGDRLRHPEIDRIAGSD